MSMASDQRLIREQVEALLELLELPDDELSEGSPISDWSIGQHLDHISLATALTFRSLDRLQTENEGSPAGPGPTWGGRLTLLLGRIPRGVGKAPEATRPAESLDRAEVTARFQESLAWVLGSATRLDDLGRISARAPHPVFGGLNIAQWLRFTAMHLDHHVRIIRDIRKARAA